MHTQLFSRTHLFCCLLFVFTLVSCSNKAPRVDKYGEPQLNYTYQTPVKSNDGWNTSSLNLEKSKAAKITKCMRLILNRKYKNIHSVLIVKNGRLVLEEYFYGYNKLKNHQIRSATKSIGSVLVGIAIDHKFVKSVDEKIYPYFNNYIQKSKWDNKAREVTIKSLLTMTSGYDCDDFKSKYSCERNMYKSPDWVEYALNLPMVNLPGEHWAYNSASLILLGDIISKSTKMPVPDFANKYLFGPLGIAAFQWGFSPAGKAFLAGNARMRPRDMAKIGYLVLNNGKWNGKQIVSQGWIKKSTGKYYIPYKSDYQNKNQIKYGYLWWHRTFSLKQKPGSVGKNIETCFASGNGGQRIYIFPALNMVAVFTGGNYNSPLADQPNEMLQDYILPAFL